MKISFKKTAMGVSATGVVLVALFEGFAPEAMQPLSGDKWTVGFGHTAGVKEGDSVSPKEALALLDKDLSGTEAAVNRLVTVPLRQCQFDALVSLVFNIGEGAFASSSLLRAVNRMDSAEIDRQWMRWVYFKGKRIRGLENRRARELAVFNGEPVVEAGSTVCFGSGLCIDSGVLLQERAQGPDGAESSGAGGGAEKL